MSSSISASEEKARIRFGLTSGARKAIAVMGVTALVTPLLYVGLVLFQLGSWHSADWWLRDIIALKRILYAEQTRGLPTESPKNIIVGGSASLFGVNSSAIAEATDTPTFGFGLHAGLDLDLLFAQLRNDVDANDNVIVPLEFEIYPRQEPTDLSASNLLAFFYKDAAAIPPSHLPRLVLAVSPVNVVDGAIDRVLQLLGLRDGNTVDETALKNAWQQARSDPSAAKASNDYYGYSNLSPHGDKILLHNTPLGGEEDARRLRTPVSGDVSSYTAKVLTDWRALFADANAHLYLTWPVILEDDAGTVFTEGYWQTLINLARDADDHGLPIYCDPVAAVIPVQYRFDSAYHLNFKGSLLYSESLAGCIKAIDSQAFDWKTATAASLAARAKARIAALKQPPDPLIFGYERNIRQLGALHDAIEAEHAATGRYPAALPPFDPAVRVVEVDPLPFQPVYRSDGQNYKLVSPGSDECFAVSEGWPELIDPVQTKDGACAYGYWTAGAANW